MLTVKRTALAMLMTSALLSGMANAAEKATPVFTPEQEARIGEIAKDYLLAHPEVLVEVSQKLQAQQQEKQQQAMTAAVIQHQAALLNDKGTPSYGPADAKVTVVEFFDYQCIYCARLAPELEKVMKANPGVRFVFKELPIFGTRWPASLMAAKTGLQIYQQKGSEAYLQSKIGMTLEIELGCTGGEEDGVDNSHMDASALYTQPEDVDYAYTELSKISPRFTIAASFGNVHGVYKPGNVVLTPTILRDSQEYVSKKHNLPHNSLNFVFHGGSGSTAQEIKDSVSYGVVKMNIDTDTQWATWEGVLNYYKANEAYLQGQLGNPKGEDQPNKKYYDPRVWLRAGQTSMIARLEKAFQELNAIDVL
ncbi:class II fructose-bisphosphate aldolase [Escherichia coli]|nr:class II fructose-bisphosphate aldolase [Escherichia coli]